MSKLRYPVGMATFSELIEEGYTYVDKTGLIRPLLSQGKFIFLSRPRRFGKSLLLSTLEAFFEGHRELFKGLEVDRLDLDWSPSPVLHFDLNNGFYDRPEGLENRLIKHLSRYESKYGIIPQADHDVALRFETVIETAYEQTGRRVVILIDEYDKPLLAVEHDKAQMEKNQYLLKVFFSNLKSMDRYIRFAFITGVARFSKVSIFSDLNNLVDISMESDFADICGWSETELLDNFRPGIEALAEEREEDFDSTMNELREFYDGYLFSLKGSRLYNPYSVLKALKKKVIDPYWFDRGTPMFLAKRIRVRGTFPPSINGTMCTRKELISVGLNDRNPIPLMFQTGYLTISKYHKDMQLYELRFPNREVETGFYEELLQIYAPDTADSNSAFSFSLFKQDLFDGHPHDFMKRLATMLKGLPHEDHCEPAYRAITYLLAVLSGNYVVAEHHGYKGRSDIEIFAGRFIYVFEFKYNHSAREAMDQIRSRDYAGRNAMDSRSVYMIAANFDDSKDNRGLHYEIELMKK